MTIKEMLKILKTELDEKKFVHSVHVMETAEKMANVYHVDMHKASVAGLLHDCAKNIKGKEAIDMAKKYGYPLDDIELVQTKLLHGPLGAICVKEKFGVTDTEILDAIHYHTTGRAGMSLLEKIIYVADYIEPGRKFKEVVFIREKAYRDLDQSVVLCAESTIRYIMNKGQLIHPKSIEARNDILLKKNRK